MRSTCDQCRGHYLSRPCPCCTAEPIQPEHVNANPDLYDWIEDSVTILSLTLLDVLSIVHGRGYSINVPNEAHEFYVMDKSREVALVAQQHSDTINLFPRREVMA